MLTVREALKTLDETVYVALKIDQWAMSQPHPAPCTFKRFRSQRSIAPPSPPFSGGVVANSSSFSIKEPKQLRKLSKEERERHWREGLCCHGQQGRPWGIWEWRPKGVWSSSSGVARLQAGHTQQPWWCLKPSALPHPHTHLLIHTNMEMRDSSNRCTHVHKLFKNPRSPDPGPWHLYLLWVSKTSLPPVSPASGKWRAQVDIGGILTGPTHSIDPSCFQLK